MKIANKLISVLLSICLILACASGISAVDGTPNVTMTVSSTSVDVGDTVTVTVSCIEHTVAGFGFYLEFDKDLLECTEIIGAYGEEDPEYYCLFYLNSRGREAEVEAQVKDSVENTNSDGIYSFGWVPGSDTTILEQTLITLNFTAKAAGTANFVLNEQSSGTDEFKGVADDTQSVTINAPVSYPAVNLMGFNGDWGTGLAMTTTDGVTYTYTMELTSGTYEFKIKDDGTWLGNGGTIVDTTTATSATGWEFVDAGNCKLQASGGTYTFSFNAETNMLIITAELDESAHTHTWVDGKCEGCGETKAVYLKGGFNDWGETDPMTWGEGGLYTITKELAGGEYEFKIVADGSWLTNTETIEDTTNGAAWELYDNSKNITLDATGGTYTFTYDINNNTLKVDAVLPHTHNYGNLVYTWNDYYTSCTVTGTCTSTVGECTAPNLSADCDITASNADGKLTFTATYGEASDKQTMESHATRAIYFYDSLNWAGTGTINAYYWGDNNNPVEWPGVAATDLGDGLYVAILPEGCDYIIFNNGSSQTQDLTWPTEGQNVAAPNGNWIDGKAEVSWGYNEPSQHTISFVYGNGSDMNQDYYYGETIFAVPDPSWHADGCTKYTFTAWKDQNGNLYDSETIYTDVTGDTTFTAQYSEEIVHTPGADATCTEDQTCTVCGEVLTEKLGHTPGEAKVENKVAPDCNNAGSYDNVVYCTVCGEELSRDTATVPAKGHSKTDVSYEDNFNGTHNVICKTCGKVSEPNVPCVYVNGTCICTAKQSVDINYHANGGNMYVDGGYYGEDVFYTFTYTWSESVEVKADKVNRYEFYVYYAGKQFAGWNTKADGTGTAYAIGDTITLTENITLYAQYKDIAVDGVALNSGEYLDCNGNVTTTKPDGGYAYYANGILTLHNFVGTGGVHATSAATQETGVYYEGSLTMVLEGDNSLRIYKGIYCYGLTIQGEGSLTITSEYTAIDANAVTIESGNITLTGDYALYADYDITITGGTVTGTGYMKSYGGNLILDGVVVITPAGTTFGSYWSENYLLGSDGEPVTSFVIGVCEHAEKTYTDLENGFHKVTCDTCGETVAESEGHDYTYDAQNHKCACGVVAEYKLTVYVMATGEVVELSVPYGANLLDTLAQAVADGKTPAIGDRFRHDDDLIGEKVVTGYSYYDESNDTWIYDLTGWTMPAEDLKLDQDAEDLGWQINEDGIRYAGSDGYLYGWNYIEEDYDDVDGGAWYYFDDEGYRVEGISRVPYPTEAINGIYYAPNADDKAYWDANQDTSKYTDAETAMFVFDENGKFVADTGIVDGNRYAVNGMIGWNVGLVEVDGDYYYFKGDVNGGGNIMATGNVYATRDYNSGMNVGTNVIYTFAEDGKLCKYTGITEIDGGLYYYNDDYSIGVGAGLIQIDGDYYYVRSSGTNPGQLVVSADFWVADVKDFNLTPGMYSFDENGKLLNPIDPTVYHGIVDIDGVLYYYQNGVKQSGKGVVELVDENGETFYIYVRSNGQLATGIYWPTTRNGYLPSGAYNWGEDGKYYPSNPNVIVEIRNVGGTLYYYENGVKQSGKGVVQMTDENGETYYIYVRSNGALATGVYWPTTRNDLLDRGAYDWGTDGRYYPEG